MCSLYENNATNLKSNIQESDPGSLVSIMDSEESTTRLSTAALVAIGCNALVAVLLLLLCLILCRACRVPSSPERLPVLAPSEAGNQQAKEHKYLLTL